jgi:hypothetical protein
MKNSGPSRTDAKWQAKAAAILKAEMARRNVSYRELEARLRAIGVEDNEKNLSTKVSRGRFATAFFLQCMAAIGCQVIRLNGDD